MPCICGLFLCLFIRSLPGSAAGLILPVSGTRSLPDLPQSLFYLYLAISEIACMFSNAMGILSSP